MQDQIQDIRLKFSCPANWNEMTPMAGGRFCDHCAKVVYDFTDSKQAEFQKILAENSGGVCGRFRQEQMASQPVLLPLWKRWLSAAMLLLGINMFTQCRRDYRQEMIKPPDGQDLSVKPTVTMGVILISRPDTLKTKAH